MRLTRFLVVRWAADEVVLCLVAHVLLLDERSMYLVLGAVMEAYRGRYRTGHYRDFTEMLDFEPLNEATAAGRRRWWSTWLAALPPAEDTGVDRRDGELRRVAIPTDQWRALAAAGGSLRDNGSLGVAALVAWWMQSVGGRPPASGMASILDLREYFDLGRMVGPLTDKMVFRVDVPPAGTAPSFRELFRKAQVGVLRSVAHYLPYGQLVDLAVGLGPGRAAPHLCPLGRRCAPVPQPGTAAAVPGTRTPRASRLEHFREADLLGSGANTPPADWDGTNVDLHLGELGAGMSLVVDMNRRHPAFTAERLIDGIGRSIAAAAADPDAPLVLATGS